MDMRCPDLLNASCEQFRKTASMALTSDTGKRNRSDHHVVLEDVHRSLPVLFSQQGCSGLTRMLLLIADADTSSTARSHVGRRFGIAMSRCATLFLSIHVLLARGTFAVRVVCLNTLTGLACCADSFLKDWDVSVMTTTA